MPFLQEARARIAAGDLSPEMQIVIQYLLQHGVGRNSPVPTETILGLLGDAGYLMTPNRFQTTLLNQTREGEIFIASGSRGLFLIETEEDARAMRDFYQSLIDNQEAKKRRLERLAADAGWQL